MEAVLMEAVLMEAVLMEAVLVCCNSLTNGTGLYGFLMGT
jgi:hypothetical protein